MDCRYSNTAGTSPSGSWRRPNGVAPPQTLKGARQRPAAQTLVLGTMRRDVYWPMSEKTMVRSEYNVEYIDAVWMREAGLQAIYTVDRRALRPVQAARGTGRS